MTLCDIKKTNEYVRIKIYIILDSIFAVSIAMGIVALLKRDSINMTAIIIGMSVLGVLFAVALVFTVLLSVKLFKMRKYFDGYRIIQVVITHISFDNYYYLLHFLSSTYYAQCEGNQNLNMKIKDYRKYAKRIKMPMLPLQCIKVWYNDKTKHAFIDEALLD